MTAKRNKRRRKRLRKSDYILIASIAAVVIYTVAAIFTQILTSTELSPTLTERWYDFWTIEIVTLSGIKITNVIKGEKDSSDLDSKFNSSNRED